MASSNNPGEALSLIPENVKEHIVTYSHHLNLTDFEVGASCSIALQGKAKTGYPRVSRGSFLSGYGYFLCGYAHFISLPEEVGEFLLGLVKF